MCTLHGTCNIASVFCVHLMWPLQCVRGVSLLHGCLSQDGFGITKLQHIAQGAALSCATERPQGFEPTGEVSDQAGDAAHYNNM